MDVPTQVGRAANSWFFFPDKLAVFPPHWNRSGARAGRGDSADADVALLVGVATSSDDFHDRGWTGRHFASFDSGGSWAEVDNTAHESWRDAHMCLPWLGASPEVGTGLTLRNIAPKSRSIGERCIRENRIKYRSLTRNWPAHGTLGLALS